MLSTRSSTRTCLRRGERFHLGDAAVRRTAVVSTTPSVAANNLKDLFELVRKDRRNTPSHHQRRVPPAIWRSSFSSTMPASARWWCLQGTAPALTDLMSGQIQLLADPISPRCRWRKAARSRRSLDQPQARGAAPEFRRSRSPRERVRVRVMVWIVGAEEPAAEVSAKLQATSAKVLALPDTSSA